jgi:3-hexulose-6-phosphate synthase / 6-phospho-3-hexuloisomerase
MMKPPRLQVALDTTDLDRALFVAAETVGVADRIEVGTPLLRKYGVSAIEAVRAKFDDAVVVADFKIMDRGELEAGLAIDAGASGVIVQAAAAVETVEAVCRTAERYGAFTMVDCIGIADVSAVAKELHGLPLSHLIIHKSKDEQSSNGPIRASEVPYLTNEVPLPALALAGGITLANVPRLIGLADIDIIIVGQAIVSSATPADVARSLLAAWH